ncbi:hypothetical protein Ahy_B09g098991 isoform A [Arachis hypogaea]|uniref:Legume lectin domain-containing protein n=1 Tax=Arachis hypogaea TaxID=3818 RepID=A0A444XSS5_ARAHY|nr:hypothetical protein Ahy_B09g098991 isoform A [Arachis hypogaea]
MAISTKNLLPPFFIAIFLTLLNTATSTDSLSFSFINFAPDERNLILQGDAEISADNNVVKLTKTNATGHPLPNTVGRVLHTAQVRLWEQSTNRLASFETQFSFYLTGPSGSAADGIAFFIAPSFDTFVDHNSNKWDPYYRHIGIDVNSIKSSAVTYWSRRDNQVLNVLISYNPTTKTLTVVATYPDGQRFELSHVVDLRTVLPEWVRVGFSAASGQLYETHNLASWSFTSSLLYTAQKENQFIKLARGA